MLYDIIGRAVTKTTRITEPTKIGTTIAAEGKGAIRATVKKTVVDILRLVKAISNGIRRVAGKAASLAPEESTSEEEEEEAEDNEQVGNLEEGQEEVGEVAKAEEIEKGREQSNIEGLGSIRVASSPGQAVLSDSAC